MNRFWGKNLSMWLVIICLVSGITGIFASRSLWLRPKGQIVFVKECLPGYPGIYVMDSDGNNVEHLTARRFREIASPVWSPDGNLIAFGCDYSGEYNICIMGREGMWRDAPYKSLHEPKLLLEPTKAPANFCSHDNILHSLSWSADGERLAFTCPQSNASGELVCIIDLEGEMDCWSLSLLLHQSKGGSAGVAWSPTEDILAISIESRIYLSSPDGQTSQFLVEGKNPTWSPDGQRLVFFRVGQILIIDRDATHQKVLYESLPSLLIEDLDKTPHLINSTATWSPDGHFIAFSACRQPFGGGFGIYLLNLRSGEVERISVLYDGRFAEPNWSW